MVRNGAGVEDILGALLTLVLNRVKEHVILGLEDRQHRLAAGGGPAAENHGHFVGVDQLLGFLGKGGPVGGTVFDDWDNFVRLASNFDAAGGIDFVDRHFLDFFQSRFGNSHGATE